MADLADLANQEAEIFLKQAIQASKEKRKHAKSHEDCVSCGESLPAARKELGLSLCIDCAQEAEQRQQSY